MFQLETPQRDVLCVIDSDVGARPLKLHFVKQIGQRLGLNIGPRTDNLAFLNRLKSIVTGLLLALWLPATSHSLLQQAGWVHTEHADEADAPDTDNDHDAADGICCVAT